LSTDPAKVKFRYTAIFALQGVSWGSEGDREIAVDESSGVRVVLTSDPDKFAFEGDRSLAVATLMLGSLFSDQSTDDQRRDRVSGQVERIQQSRRDRLGGYAALVFVAEGEVESFHPSNERETHEFAVCFDAADKEEIKRRFEDSVAAVLTAVSLALPGLVGFVKLKDSVVFERSDGKPLYSYTFTTGPVRAIVSSKPESKALDEIGCLFDRLRQESQLNRVQRLVRSSFDDEQDRLRAFLAAWTALEILVNKVFAGYEQRYFSQLLEEQQPLEAKAKFLRRIQDVMKDKYRLSDKFGAIAFQLAPLSADQDLKDMLSIKAVRDKLLHGDDVSEGALPLEPARNLVVKYFGLHVGKT
jgi:hypothetical protein